ncbi:MAG TPA: acyl carrier protein [Telluria sp.]
MDYQHTRDEVVRALRIVSPDVDGIDVADDEPLRDQLRLDEQGWRNFGDSVRNNLHADIPEAEFARLSTLREIVNYVTTH